MPSSATDATTAPRWLDERQQRAWRQIIAGATHLLDQLDRELRVAHDLTMADYEILVHLSEAPDSRLRMAELADAALVSRSRLTHRVDRMVARGLVEREACPTDRRGTFAVLTADGRRAIEAAAPTHVEGVRRYVVDPIDPDALDALGTGMGAVAAAIAEALAADDPGTDG